VSAIQGFLLDENLPRRVRVVPSARVRPTVESLLPSNKLGCEYPDRVEAFAD
jgi:hypothetical protein